VLFGVVVDSACHYAGHDADWRIDGAGMISQMTGMMGDTGGMSAPMMGLCATWLGLVAAAIVLLIVFLARDVSHV
jgi:hypothetical protein